MGADVLLGDLQVAAGEGEDGRVAALSLRREDRRPDHQAVAAAGLGVDGERHHGGARAQRQPGEDRAGEGRPAEEGDGDPLPLLHPLVDQDAEPAALADRLQHPARGAVLGDDGVAEALAQGAQLAVEPRVVRRADHDAHRTAGEADQRRRELPEAEVGGEQEESLAEPLGLVDVLPALEGEEVAEVGGAEAGRGDGVAQGGAEVAEALADQAPPLPLRQLREREGHVAQRDLPVPAVDRVGESPEPPADRARRRMGERPQEPLDRQIEGELDPVADGAVFLHGMETLGAGSPPERSALRGLTPWPPLPGGEGGRGETGFIP